MPTYQIECLECGTTENKRITFSDYDAIKTGTQPLTCRNCQKPAQIGFTPGGVNFVLKDGESGSWASKAIKESAYRGRRRNQMAQREKDHVFKSSLQPNYDGVETGTWKDAQELARKEKGNESATTYDPLVQKSKVAK